MWQRQRLIPEEVDPLRGAYSPPIWGQDAARTFTPIVQVVTAIAHPGSQAFIHSPLLKVYVPASHVATPAVLFL